MKSIIQFFSISALFCFSSLTGMAQQADNQLRHASEFVVKNNVFPISAPSLQESNTPALRSSSQDKLFIDPSTTNRLRSASGIQAVGDTLLIEGFEAFTGTDQTWLPTGWTRKTTNTFDMKKTWFIGAPQASLNSSKYLSFVEFDYDNASDEWLITPELTLGAQNDMIFYLLSNPSEMFYTDKYGVTHKDQITATFQIMISVNGGEYTTLFDAAKDVNYTDDEFKKIGYRQMRVKLHDYASKKVKIGFRYVGKGGGSIGLDDIFIGNLYPSAWYYRPIGTYYNGFSDELTFSPGYFVPAYKDLQFVNDSWYSDRYYWDGLYRDGYSYLESTEFSPTFSVSTVAADLPYLTSYLDNKNSTFQYNYRGSGSLKAGHYGYAMNVDINNSIVAPKFTNSDYFLFGTYHSTPATPEQRPFSFEAIGNWFEKPAQKAIVSNISVILGTLTGPADTELTLDAMRVEESGSLTLLTSGKLKISDAKDLNEQFKILHFSLNDTLFVDYPVLYMLRGYNVPGVSLGAYCNNYSDMQESNAFILIKYDDNQETVLRNASSLYGNYSLLFIPSLAFPVLHPDKENIVCEVSAGTAAISIETTFTPDKLKVYTADDWVTLSGATFDNNPAKFLFSLELAYEALPAGMQGRSSSIRITQLGTDDLIIPIYQGTVSDINKTRIPEPEVYNKNGAFEMIYSNVNLLEIYSISGQKLQEVKLPASGNYTLDHKHLASGVYILKFSGKEGSYSVKKTK